MSIDLVRGLRTAFEARRDPVRAAGMSAYMRDQFPFLGIPGPERSALERTVFRTVGPLDESALALAARALWALPEREYQYAACALLARNNKRLAPEFIAVARELVTTKSWWDTVDTLASHVVGGIIRHHREAQQEMDLWIESPDHWVARTALLHQLRFKGETDAARLFRYCELRAADKEFFIRKAIGWALREYSKTDADAVRAFVAGHEATLSGLSKREALLWLNGGRRSAAPETGQPNR